MGFSPFRPTGLTHFDEERASPGYTMFSMIYGERTYLVDMRGEVVRTWTPPDANALTYHAELLPNGNVLMMCITPGEEYRPGGCTSAVELDWDGKVVWRYDSPMLHHAFVRRANGNTLVLEWSPMPDDVAASVRAASGQPTSGDKRPMLGDAIREIDPSGKTVWRWEAHVALDPHVDKPCLLHKFDEWTHCNGVDEAPNGDLLLTFRLTDTVALLDRATGRFRWRWGRGVLGHPHDASLLPDGKVLVFDNEWHAIGKLDHSRLVEVDMSSEIVWQYSGSPKTSFSSAHLGGAQRLPNGNTLACEGSSGRLFEVTRGGEMVWEYVNPFVCTYRDDKKSPRILKARRYAPSHPGLAARF